MVKSIVYHKRFRKSFEKLPNLIKSKAITIIEIFQHNPFEKQLRNHKLHKEFEGFRSIDVTGDYRIIFRELSNNMYELVELVDVGTHAQLY